MERIEVTYRVVTPLFCGGARPSSTGVRLPSFKGVLRWWWRALAWARSGGDLGWIRRSEDDLFGSAGGGQSRLSMRMVSKPGGAAPARRDGDQLQDAGARYLAYGVTSSRSGGAPKPARACLWAPFDLAISMYHRPRSAEGDVQRELLLDALRAIGVLGGFGAKSRKGYGSLVLRALTAGGSALWSPPATATALLGEIKRLVGAAGSATVLPPYTALASRSRVIVIEAAAQDLTPLALLARVGREMLRYRSWGQRGQVLGEATEGNFRDDHDLMKQPPRARRGHPRRIVFGLPHNYGGDRGDEVGPGDLERRASPLLVHLHECGDRPVAVLSFLPAVFLPEGDRARISVGGQLVAIAPDPMLWDPIHALLDRFLNKPGIAKPRKESFGEAMEVRP